MYIMKKIFTQYSKTKKIFIKKMSNWSPVEDGEDVTTFHRLGCCIYINAAVSRVACQ